MIMKIKLTYISYNPKLNRFNRPERVNGLHTENRWHNQAEHRFDILD